MRSTMYRRGKYNKQYPKETKITFLSDELTIVSLHQLSGMKHKSMSQVIREAIHEYYVKSVTIQE
jgi:hypothetical protein